MRDEERDVRLAVIFNGLFTIRLLTVVVDNLSQD